ncbi:hypothetical protein RHGRI_032200 [Rhododendron griersonianum]|uniref:Uncharacterized protein n=1 Tax=Rhododendron griersonianum TaxID=479676 RepID=A0AAV6IDE5_9ERIC|nr:hypothetical protein RHGRI_032200 [Rhododendron griersonianum]
MNLNCSMYEFKLLSLSLRNMDCWRRSSARSRQAVTGLSSKAGDEIRMRGRRSSTALRKALASMESN